MVCPEATERMIHPPFPETFSHSSQKKEGSDFRDKVSMATLCNQRDSWHMFFQELLKTLVILIHLFFPSSERSLEKQTWKEKKEANIYSTHI